MRKRQAPSVRGRSLETEREGPVTSRTPSARAARSAPLPRRPERRTEPGRSAACGGGSRLSRRDRFHRWRSEEHTSELQSLMRISYAVFCLKKKKKTIEIIRTQDSG